MLKTFHIFKPALFYKTLKNNFLKIIFQNYFKKKILSKTLTILFIKF